MSVQKLVAEADKLLEKGKLPEGIAKLKQALQGEPLNQIVATKLANNLVQSGNAAEAAKVYGSLAKRLSEAGKAQLAIAIYKQAIELSPDDVNLRVKFAQECESVGKLGDAFLQAQIALQYYLKRKKYFDAADLMPVLARSQPKDEKVKTTWAEVLYLSQAEQKVVHFLVAICGPPGVQSQEFPVGGEPTAMPQALYDGLKKLVPFFPRDPRIAYAVAWSAYRRGRMKEFYHYLHESFRRDPDFSLAVLLLARVLAENQKLNEAMFAYKYFKDRIASDKSIDMLTLNRLMETFLEKNGWVKFLEDSGETLDAGGFLKAITGVDTAGSVAETEVQQEEREEKEKSVSMRELPPAEIELGGGSSEGGADPGMEILLATGQNISEVNKQQKPAAPIEQDPVKLQAELIKAAIEATVLGMGGKPPVADVAPVPEKAEEKTKSLVLPPETGEPAALTLAADDAPVAAAPAAAPAPAPAPAPSQEAGPKKNLFNPLEHAETQSPVSHVKAEERTEMFSPIDVLGAAKVMATAELSDVQTREIESPVSAPPPEKAAEPSTADLTKWKSLDAPGEPTQIYSPVDIVEAGAASRRAKESSAPTAAPAVTPPPPVPAPAVGAISTETASLAMAGEATRVIETPPPAIGVISTETASLASAGEATRILERPPAEAPAETAAAVPITELPAEAGEIEFDRPDVPAAVVPAAVAAIVPIPEGVPELRGADPEGDKIDLGDDLLDGPTRILTQPKPTDHTEHLIKEIKKELKEKAGVSNAEMLLKKAERYAAKRNYYLARKALRHAQAVGADEEMIKERLREIRKLELPEGIYSAISTDRSEKIDTELVLDRLEQEFDLALDEDSESDALGTLVDARIEAIFRESDPRTILDFGVGLQEMGLFRQAEELLLRLVENFPDYAFDAYYLAAMAKISRRDFAGAASILKRLSSDSGKTEIEKIQIYYALGETFEKMRQTDRSKEFFRKVAELDANYRNIRHKLEK